MEPVTNRALYFTQKSRENGFHTVLVLVTSLRYGKNRVEYNIAYSTFHN